MRDAKEQSTAQPPADALALRTMTDAQLMEHCHCDAFRGSGPGGQKRNKTSSAVRITHLATGLAATASESRSQAMNKRFALGRLRCRLVVECRAPLDAAAPALPADLPSPRREDYLPVMGRILDVLHAAGYALGDAAAALGLSTGRLSAFLQADQVLWDHVNRRRTALGLRCLTPRE